MIRRALVLLGSLGAAHATTTTLWGPVSGYCYSSLDREIGSAKGEDCWDMCAATYDIATTPEADRLVAVDWNNGGECYCQNDCECLMRDSQGSVITISNITSLPEWCPDSYYDDDDDRGREGMVEWPYLLLAVGFTAIVAAVVSCGCVRGGLCKPCVPRNIEPPTSASSAPPRRDGERRAKALFDKYGRRTNPRTEAEKALRAENARLREEMERATAAHEAENARLREEMERATAAREAENARLRAEMEELRPAQVYQASIVTSEGV